jgi:hypothetical protein
MKITWRTSSYSNPNGECVEAGNSGGAGECVEVAGSVLVRDSKLGEGSPVLGFTPAAWAAFTGRIKVGAP